MTRCLKRIWTSSSRRIFNHWQHLSRWVKPDVMLPGLHSATQLMMANRDPRRTLQEVFESDFYPKIGMEADHLREATEDLTIIPSRCSLPARNIGRGHASSSIGHSRAVIP